MKSLADGSCLSYLYLSIHTLNIHIILILVAILAILSLIYIARRWQSSGNDPTSSLHRSIDM